MEKLLENESMRKEKWRPGEEKLVLDMKWMESSLRLCHLRIVPLLAVLTEFEQY